MIQFYRTAGSVIGTGLHTLLTDWDKVLAAAGGMSLLALGVYTAKGTTGITARYIESRLGNFMQQQSHKIIGFDLFREAISCP